MQLFFFFFFFFKLNIHIYHKLGLYSGAPNGQEFTVLFYIY